MKYCIEFDEDNSVLSDDLKEALAIAHAFSIVNGCGTVYDEKDNVIQYFEDGHECIFNGPMLD